MTATENGVLRAILHFVPWGTDGLSLDLMRRDKTAQAGLNDFLIVEAIKAAPGLGVKRVSLNFAMFRAALERGERIGAGPVLQAWRGLLVFVSRWFQIESLYKFNAKFCPVWEPRFFVFPGGRDAPRIALAALEAEAFLVWPKLEVQAVRRRAARRLAPGRTRQASGRPPSARRAGLTARVTAWPGPPAHEPGLAGYHSRYGQSAWSRRVARGRPLPGHGRGQRDARLVLRRRAAGTAPTAAIQHGLELIAQGADIVDVGGESTRPGAQRVSADEELRRVKPVITELVKAGAVVSVDTMRAQVARWARRGRASAWSMTSAAGSPTRTCPGWWRKAGVPYVVMHWRGHSHDMETRGPSTQDVVREVHDELAQRIGAVTAEGVDPSMIVLDPGLGFSKNPAASGADAHNWQLLAGLRELAHIGGRDFPVLVGASRKRYLSRLLDAGRRRRGRSWRTTPRRPPSPRCPRPRAPGASGSTRFPPNADAVRVAAAYRAAARS